MDEKSLGFPGILLPIFDIIFIINIFQITGCGGFSLDNSENEWQPQKDLLDRCWTCGSPKGVSLRWPTWPWRHLLLDYDDCFNFHAIRSFHLLHLSACEHWSPVMVCSCHSLAELLSNETQPKQIFFRIKTWNTWRYLKICYNTKFWPVIWNQL